MAILCEIPPGGTASKLLTGTLPGEALEKLVLQNAVGEWGCEDITGITIEVCDPAVHGRNWTVTHLKNEDLLAAEHTILKVVEQLSVPSWDTISLAHWQRRTEPSLIRIKRDLFDQFIVVEDRC